MSQLREELWWKKIVDFTDEELAEAGFTGDAAPESVKELVLEIKANSRRLDFITGYDLNCEKKKSAFRNVSEVPLSPTPTDPNPFFSQVRVSSDSALTVVDGEFVSEFEKYNYYVGLCSNNNNAPPLYYRTSLKKAPFPMPTPGTKWFSVANKTAHGVFDKVLTSKLWRATIAPRIIEVLEKRGIQFASLQTTRFSTPDDTGEKQTLGPIVVWIGTYYGTTTPDVAHDTSTDILDILENHGISGAEVEWYETKGREWY